MEPHLHGMMKFEELNYFADSKIAGDQLQITVGSTSHTTRASGSSNKRQEFGSENSCFVSCWETTLLCYSGQYYTSIAIVTTEEITKKQLLQI
jgi:hypothetical protein